MKNLYHKNKGKIHPSPSSSSLPSYTANRDALSVLKLLPAAIFTLVSVLSLEDRQVLAYMITRSMKTTNPSTMIEEKKKCKKPNNNHKPPVFDCSCFDCYTSYWFRWDSSPNRELIHQAIEAFEDHLTNGELSANNSRGKKKDRVGRRFTEKPEKEPEKQEEAAVSVLSEPDPDSFMVPENDIIPIGGSDVADVEEEIKEGDEECEMEVTTGKKLTETVETLRLPTSNHKGLARKVLPDVLGLFNSRLWNLWGPNV